jgi:hypothetical protein
MKETFIWAKSLYSCLLIQPNLAFCLCLRLDSWSRGEINRPQLSETFTLPQLFLVEWKSIWLRLNVKLKLNRPKSSSYVELHHCLLEVVIYLHYQSNGLFRLRKAICIPGAIWEHESGSHQKLERFELYVVQKLRRALVPRWEDRWYHQWHDMTRTIIHQ